MKKSSIRRYRDSQRKLAIAKRQYRDSLRAYRDAEDKAKLSKLKMISSKILSRLEQFKKSNPSLIKLIKIILKIESLFKVADIGKDIGVWGILKKYAEYGDQTAKEVLEDERFKPLRLLCKMFFNSIMAFLLNKLSNKL